jgi:hypothetical protein
MKPAPRKDARENITGRSDPLAVLASNTNREIYFRRCVPRLLAIINLLVEASLRKLSAGINHFAAEYRIGTMPSATRPDHDIFG